MTHSTIPAPAAAKTGTVIPGTIGFDLYLALIASRAALRAPKTPSFS